MGKAPPISVSMAGTRNGRLRARVSIKGQLPYQVTLGGEKWFTLSEEVRQAILTRAQRYIQVLNHRLSEALLGRSL